MHTHMYALFHSGVYSRGARVSAHAHAHARTARRTWVSSRYLRHSEWAISRPRGGQTCGTRGERTWRISWWVVNVRERERAGGSGKGKGKGKGGGRRGSEAGDSASRPLAGPPRPRLAGQPPPHPDGHSRLPVPTRPRPRGHRVAVTWGPVFPPDPLKSPAMVLQVYVVYL